MYGTSETTVAGTATLAATGLGVMGYGLIAVAVIAVGATVLALVRRYRHRNGPRP